MDKVIFAEGCSCVNPVSKRITDAAFDELIHATNEQLNQAKEGLERAKAKGLNDLVEIYKDALPKLEKVLKEVTAVRDSFSQIPKCKI